MAYIYRITNKINGKIYIGKTEFSVEERFKAHCKEYKKDRCKNRPLYKAMNKYGVDNFFVETIEETNEPEEREKYWIEFYGSFKNGYNATVGGDGRKYLDYDLIYKTYLELKSARKTGELLNVSNESVVAIVKIKGELYSKNESLKKAVAKIDKETNEIVSVYSSIKEAEASVNGKNKSISKVCNGQRRTAYGYIWKFI